MEKLFSRYRLFFYPFLAISCFTATEVSVEDRAYPFSVEEIFLQSNYPGTEGLCWDTEDLISRKLLDEDDPYEEVYSEKKLRPKDFEIISDGNFATVNLLGEDSKVMRALQLDLSSYAFLFRGRNVIWKGSLPPEARIRIQCKKFECEADFSLIESSETDRRFPNFEVRTEINGPLKLSSVPSEDKANWNIFRMLSLDLGDPIKVYGNCEKEGIHIYADPFSKITNGHRFKAVEFAYYINSGLVKKIKEEAGERWTFSEPNVELNGRRVYPNPESNYFFDYEALGEV